MGFIDDYGWALLVICVMLLALAYFYQTNEQELPQDELKCELIDYNHVVAKYEGGYTLTFNIKDSIDSPIPMSFQKDGKTHDLMLVVIQDTYQIEACR